jgi:hypothetical protein
MADYPLPLLGGSWLRCPMCARRWRCRTLKQYVRHLARRHPLARGARIWTGPVTIYMAPAGAQPAAAAMWRALGQANGMVLTRTAAHGA